MSRGLLVGLVALWLACPRPVAAQLRPTDAADRTFAGLVPVNMGLAIVDARQTVRCVETLPGRCVEANPIFGAVAVTYGIRRSMTVKVAADVGVTVFAAWALHRWRNQKWAIVGGYAVNAAIKGWVIHHNRRVIAQLSR